MYPVSARFLAQSISSSNRITTVTITNGFGQVLDVSAYISKGTVTFQKQQFTRGALSMSLTDPSGVLVPHVSTDFLTPFGNTITAFTGFKYSDGTTELVPLGTFRLTDVTPADNGMLTMEVRGAGLSRAITRNKWDDDIHYTPLNTNIAQAIYDITLDRYPSASWNNTIALGSTPTGNVRNDLATFTTFTTGPQTVYSVGDDPGGRIKQWYGAAQLSFYLDRYGRFTLTTDPNVAYQQGSAPAPVFTFTEGVNCNFSQLQRAISDQNAANEVVVTGIGANVFGMPPRSYAYDNDPLSPTYIGNPIGSSRYGRVVLATQHQLGYTTAITQSFANWTLATKIGAQETVSITSAVLAALDIDDPVAVLRQRMGINNVTYLIDTITIPLEPTSQMTATFRERRSLILPTVQ